MKLEIDWAYLLELELWDLEEAICLAIGVHPSDFRDAPFTYSESEGTYARRIEGRDFNIGHKIAQRHVVALSAIEAGTLPSSSQTQSGSPKVNPQEFVKWARGKGWDLPEQLGTVAPAAKAGTASLENPKHRTSWRNLLGALCMKTGINYREPGADAKLEGLTERFGVHVGRKTIKRIVDELRDHVEWQDPPRA